MIPEAPAAAAVTLSDADRATLVSAGGWAKFLAVLDTVVVVLGMSTIGVALAVVPAMPVLVRVGLGLGGALAFSVAGVYAYLLWRYARGVASFKAGRPEGLVRAFTGLRILWMVAAFGYGLSVVVSVGMIIATLLGVMPAPDAAKAGAGP